MMTLTKLSTISLDRATLQQGYRSGTFTAADVVEEVYRRIAARGDDRVWLHLRSKDAVLEDLAALDPSAPLYGLPYGVKDNIDAAGVPTTAGCESLRYVPEQSAPLVDRLNEAGALFLGKQNLDQFATGLVGTRAPLGYCVNARDPRYIPGGSSSGSAVAVAAGLTTFSIGTDTGGSGRVPAAYNHIVGLKPTPGLLDTRGFLYCNRSFDVPSIFALNVADAHHLFDVLRGADECDEVPRKFRFGVPRPDQLEWFGDAVAPRSFDRAMTFLREVGGESVAIDYAPFLEAGRLVFQSALVAERWLTYGNVIEQHPHAVDPCVRAAIGNASRYSAADAFETLYKVEALQRAAAGELAGLACLVTPTVGTLYTIAQVQAEPFERNTHMGYYTYYANPLRLSAVSVPAGLRDDGLPFSVSLVGLGHRESQLLQLAGRLEEVCVV